MGRARFAESMTLAIAFLVVVSSGGIAFLSMNARGVEYQQPEDYLTGDEASENLGRSVALMDLNGDGIADLVCGSPYATVGGMVQAGSVTASLSYGGTPLNNVTWINGTHAGDLFGWALTNAGDLNGDGRDDLAIGAPFSDPGSRLDAGSTSVVFCGPWYNGAVNLTIDGMNAGEQFGFSLSTAGDVDEDGFMDLVAGAPNYTAGTTSGAGRAYVFYGGAPFDLTADKTFTGSLAGGHFGWSVAGGASIDQDTAVDMVVGVPDAGAGSASVIRNVQRANPPTSVIYGGALGDKFGSSVALSRDLNGDTYADVLVGAPFSNLNGADSGEVVILFGSSKFNTAVDATLTGHAAGEWFGWALASGDVRQDGREDIIVGAPNSSLNTTTSGRAYVHFGNSTISTEPDVIMASQSGGSFFGGSVCSGGNATGDIAPDFVIGDPQFNLNVPLLPNVGRAYLYPGLHVIIPHNPVVNGHVYVPGTTVGLAGFNVTIESAGTVKWTLTGTSGYFELETAPGTYWLNASKDGYVANSTTVALVMNEVEVVDFYPLTRPLVTGIVRDNVSTLPVQGATAALWSGAELIEAVTTPANGSFRIYLPDQYVPPPAETILLTLNVWSSLHYTATSELEIARNQTVVMDRYLDRFPAISGTVRDAVSLSTIRSASVTASQGGVMLASATTDLRGNYFLAAVNASVPADIDLRVTAPGYFREDTVIAADKNESYTHNFFMQTDDLAPTSELSQLATYQAVDLFSVNATANDMNGIAEVQLWYREAGAGDYSMYASDGSPPYEWIFNATVDGLFEFYSIAVDLAGNTEPEPAGNDTWTLVDIMYPTVLITSPEGSTITSLVDITMNWTAEDLVSGIDHSSVRLNDAEWIGVGTALGHVFEAVPEGAHVATVNVTDRAGNEAIALTNFVVDRTSPSVEVLLPAEGLITSSRIATLHWNATDGLSGIEKVETRVDTRPWNEAGAGNTSYTYWDMQDGEHVLTVRATDRAGNSGSDSVTMTVDTGRPVITITAPVQGDELGYDDVTIAWTASDSVTEIESAQMSIDGTAFVSLGNVQMTVVPDLDEGEHTVTIRVVDTAGNYNDATVAFTVSLEEGVLGISNMVWIGIIAVVVIAAVAAVILLRRSKGKKGAKPEQKK